MARRTKKLTAKGRPVGRYNRRHKGGVLRKKFARKTPKRTNVGARLRRRY